MHGAQLRHVGVLARICIGQNVCAPTHLVVVDELLIMKLARGEQEEPRSAGNLFWTPGTYFWQHPPKSGLGPPKTSCGLSVAEKGPPIDS